MTSGRCHIWISWHDFIYNGSISADTCGQWITEVSHRNIMTGTCSIMGVSSQLLEILNFNNVIIKVTEENTKKKMLREISDKTWLNGVYIVGFIF